MSASVLWVGSGGEGDLTRAVSVHLCACACVAVSPERKLCSPA